MFDNTTFDDLLAVEASWGDEPTDPTDPHTKKRKDWQPRKKGEKIDYDSPEYQRAYEDAAKGLPVIRTLNWLQAQLHDGGEQRGRTQFSVKLEFTDAKVENCTRSGIWQMRRTRWANLSTIANFRTNLRRKAIDIRAFDQHDRDNGERMVEVAQELDGTEFGAPACRLGWLSHRFEGKGTLIYGSQHVLLHWRPAEIVDNAVADWLPSLLITRRRADGSSQNNQMDRLVVDLRLPAPTNRDGTPRRPSAFTHVGNWYSPALQERIDTAKAIKQMRTADRGGRA